MNTAASNRDKTLFTPGPLTTSTTVKQAMLRDLGSRDDEFIALVREIRRRLVALAGDAEGSEYEAIPMQGSGTFGIEAVISSVIPREGTLLVLVNGAYGERMVQIAERLGIHTTVLRFDESEPTDPSPVGPLLQEDPAITHVAVVHCETTTGILNPVTELGCLVQENGRRLIVDAMSSFGAVPIEMKEQGIDYLVSSSNKCLEGVPGFSLVVARRSALEATRGFARSVSLDLLAQWEGLEKNGQFRFTPPTHAILAFGQALKELEAEGGVSGRAARYRANHDVLMTGMQALGFRPYLRPEYQSDVITAFHYPEDPRFEFERFYLGLAEKGMVIYPGKLSRVSCFRIGTIGRIGPEDIDALLKAIRLTLQEMRVAVPF